MRGGAWAAGDGGGGGFAPWPAFGWRRLRAQAAGKVAVSARSHRAKRFPRWRPRPRLTSKARLICACAATLRTVSARLARRARWIMSTRASPLERLSVSAGPLLPGGAPGPVHYLVSARAFGTLTPFRLATSCRSGPCSPAPRHGHGIGAGGASGPAALARLRRVVVVARRRPARAQPAVTPKRLARRAMTAMVYDFLAMPIGCPLLAGDAGPALHRSSRCLSPGSIGVLWPDAGALRSARAVGQPGSPASSRSSISPGRHRARRHISSAQCGRNRSGCPAPAPIS